MTTPRLPLNPLGACFALALACSLGAAPGSAGASSLPDWAQAALAGGGSEWKPERARVLLLNSETVRFLAPDHIQTTWRGVEKIHILTPGSARVFAARSYDSDLEKIVSADAWALSADGKQTRRYRHGNFTDTIAVNNPYYWIPERIIQFSEGDQIEVGETLAWEIQIDSQLGLEGVSTGMRFELPARRCTFEVIPYPGGALDWFASNARLKSPAPGSEPGSLEWGLSDQPPIPTPFPARKSFDHFQVFARCSAPGQPRPTWRDFSNQAFGIINPRMDAGGDVRTTALSLVADKTTRWDRIRALATFVQKQVVYLELQLDRDNLAGYRPHPAADTLRTKYGDCKDKANLLVSMLRAIGDDGRVVLLMAEDPQAVEAGWPSAQFDHAIAAIPADGATPASWPVVNTPAGRFVIFDPTDPSCPLGVLSRGDQAGLGMLVDARAGDLFTLPTSGPETTGLTQRIDVRLDPLGNGLIAENDELRGLLAAQLYSERSAQTRLQFTHGIEFHATRINPLARAIEWTDQWDPSLSRYQLHLRFHAARFGQPLPGGMMLVKPALAGFNRPLAPWVNERPDGSILRDAQTSDSEIRIAAPGGYAIDEVPDAWEMKRDDLSVQVSYRIEGSAATCRLHSVYLGGEYVRKSYESLRLDLLKLDSALRRPILLKRAL